MDSIHLHDLIYDKFVSSILFGYYTKGDKLPSMNSICGRFNLAPLTIRRAMSAMEKDGYIRISGGKRAEVIYEQSEEKIQQNIADYFGPRIDYLSDIAEGTALMLTPIIGEALKRVSVSDAEYLKKIADNHVLDTPYIIDILFAMILKTLNNSLIMNIQWEINRYDKFAQLYRKKSANSQNNNVIREFISCFADSAAINDYDGMIRNMINIRDTITNAALSTLNDCHVTSCSAENKPFQLLLYREHPQKCYSIAADILSKIRAKQYISGQYLPSCSTMAKEYNVSTATMRRTINMLSRLNAVRTVNGVGTLVTGYMVDGVTPDFMNPQIKKNIIYGFKALHFIALSCENVAKHTLSAASDEKLSLLLDKLKEMQQNGDTIRCLSLCIEFISQNSPLSVVRECYRIAFELMIWSYTLRIFEQQKNKHTHPDVDNIISALSKKEFDMFSAQLGSCYRWELQGTMTLLSKLGYTKEEIISDNFLISEN